MQFSESWTLNGRKRLASGELYLRKPGKMRWEYSSPREKLFVSDGHEAWFYVPEDRQARKTEVKELDDLRSPLAFLLGKTRLEKELHGLSAAPDIPPLDPADVAAIFSDPSLAVDPSMLPDSVTASTSTATTTTTIQH